MTKTLTTAFSTLMLACVFTTFCSAQLVTSSDDIRLVMTPDGSRDGDNGGNTISGRLIGINPGGVDNFMVLEFNDMSPVSGAAVSGATVDVFVAQTFAGNANHGQATDIISLSEIPLPNIGWDGGTGVIGGSPNGTDDGSISYLNREQYLPGSANGTSVPWVDASSASVANITQAMTFVDDTPGYDSTAVPVMITFDVNAATAQSWVDNGLAGLVLSNVDDGSGRSRFNFTVDPTTDSMAHINFIPVPEPSGFAIMLTLIGVAAVCRNRKAA